MDDSNPSLKAAVLEMVKAQLRLGDPPEARATLERLKGEGWSEEDAKNHIGRALLSEMYYVTKESKPFNRERYLRNLARLPDDPEA